MYREFLIEFEDYRDNRENYTIEERARLRAIFRLRKQELKEATAEKIMI